LTIYSDKIDRRFKYPALTDFPVDKLPDGRLPAVRKPGYYFDTENKLVKEAPSRDPKSKIERIREHAASKRNL